MAGHRAARGPRLGRTHGTSDLHPALGRGNLGFYDGRATVEQNFEEQLGLAYSYDLLRWLKLTPATPWRRSPHGGGALRYLDAAADREVLRLVYEYARPDGAHEMRENLLPPLHRTDPPPTRPHGRAATR